MALYFERALPKLQRPSSLIYNSNDQAREFMTKLANLYPQFTVNLKNENPLERLSGVQGGFVRWMPDMSLLKVEGSDKVYTLIRNKYHDNVSFVFGESLRLNPDKDTFTVAEGYVGNYPNFYFSVPGNEIDQFVSTIEAISSKDSFQRLFETYGIRRSSSEFWSTNDWFNRQFAKDQPIRAGILDLNRYGNF